jgi:hypothetical protein
VARQETDFQKIVQDLRDWGWSDTELAKETGVPRTKFAKLRSGAHNQPIYDDGCAIMALHKKQAKKL